MGLETGKERYYMPVLRFCHASSSFVLRLSYIAAPTGAGCRCVDSMEDQPGLGKMREDEGTLSRDEVSIKQG